MWCALIDNLSAVVMTVFPLRTMLWTKDCINFLLGCTCKEIDFHLTYFYSHVHLNQNTYAIQFKRGNLHWEHLCGFSILLP